jgi:hypothetical protein
VGKLNSTDQTSPPTEANHLAKLPLRLLQALHSSRVEVLSRLEPSSRVEVLSRLEHFLLAGERLIFEVTDE